MSEAFRWQQIIRCPLCRDGASPEHVGNGVMLCECCGNIFRVVYASRNKTGTRLAKYVADRVQFAAEGTTKP